MSDPITDGALALSKMPQPRYLALAKSLAAEIARGAVVPGDRLPGERELCRSFGVSRVTVRRALAELRDQGMIEPDGPRGWFVLSASLGEPNALMSFSEMARSRGLTPTSRVVVAEVRPATIDEAEALTIAPGADVFHLERVRKLDGVSVALEHSRLPLAVAPALIDSDLAVASLYEVLSANGATPARAEYVLQAIPAEARQARLLEVDPGAPLLMTSATTYDETGREIELSRAVFRGDRYRFRTTLFGLGKQVAP